jgi:4-carboxymuconolactone decarboxylase
MAIYAFVRELYATRRVSDATYKRVHKLLGDAGMVELAGILGYYAMVSMILNAFRMPVPEGTPAPFREANK